MERLTYDGNFCDIAMCREMPCPHDNNCTQKQVWERLKQYEDTGLSPEWIFPSEKLPPDGRNVLCWYEYFRYGNYNRMFQTFGIGYQYNGYWGGEVSNGYKTRVLAWMPLPEPPEMEGGTSDGEIH